MIQLTPGGQAYKSGDYVFGDRWSFLQFPNTVAYSYPAKEKRHVNVEMGPSINFLVGAKNYTKDPDGKKEENKIEIAENDVFKRVNLSVVIEASYTWGLPRYDLSVGLKGDLGITPTLSFENSNGDKTNFKAQSLSLTLEISNSIGDLLGKDKYLDYYDPNLQIDTEILEAETTYDLVILGFRKARYFRDKSRISDNADSSKFYAEQALEWETKTRQWLGAGVNDWNDGDINSGVGPTSQRLISGFLDEINKTSQTMADSVWEVPVLIIETLTDTTGDDPRDSPPPVIYGEEIDLANLTWKGQFEASQGVWQDDYVFKDKPKKRLTIESETDNHAELDLVSNRFTAVYGTRDDIRYQIKITGTSTYSQKIPVHMRLKLIQNGEEKIIWTDPNPTAYIPLEGGLGASSDWEASRSSLEGSPVPRQFLMKEGAYQLELHLTKPNGDETGIKITTHGTCVSTHMPIIHIAPVNITDDYSLETVRKSMDAVKKIASSCETFFPYYFPIPHGGLTIRTHPMQNFANDKLGALDAFVSILPFTNTSEEVRKDRILAKMIDRYGSASRINGGRTVLYLRETELKEIYRSKDVAGFAPNAKVVFVLNTFSSTVAHELIHTMPYLFSRTRMEALCDKNYHNSADNDYAYGAEVSSYSSKVVSSESAIMSSASFPVHPTQCTFYHLTDYLQAPVDPKLYLVRGFIYKDDTLILGKLANCYEISGEQELLEGTIDLGSWGIRLLDQSGKQLAAYPFTPAFEESESEELRNLVAFNHLINRVKGTAKIELIGPQGVLSEQVISQRAPKLVITSPSRNSVVDLQDGEFSAKWEGIDDDGNELTYLVYYSPDGKAWRPVGGELTSSSVNVQVIGTPPNPQIKIIASDGMRSDEKIVKFYLSK